MKDLDVYKSNYNKGKHPLPSSTLPLDDEKKWFLSMVDHAYALYSVDGLYYGRSHHLHGRSISELRSYARGKQDPQKYMDILDPDDKNSKEKGGMVNISWANLEVMPKFRDVILGIVDKIKFDFDTVAVDENSRKEKDFKLGEMKFLAMNETKQMYAEAGQAPNVEYDMNGIDSPEDVDLLDTIGGIKGFYEIEMKDAIQATLLDSQYEEGIRGQMVEDIFDLNVACCEVKITQGTGRVITKYIDPAKAFWRQSAMTDCRDIDMAGYFESKTIAQLREESGLDEKALYQISKSYRKEGSNRDKTFSNVRSYREEYAQNNGSQIYDGHRVDVMTLYFVANKAEEAIVHTEGDSGVSNYRNIQHVFRVHWVVGTRYIYDYGVERGVVRKGSAGYKKADLPMKIYQGNGPSLVSRCIGFCDDLQIAVLKKRQLIAKIPPGPRVAIDLSRVNDRVQIGNDSISLIESIDGYTKNGILVYESGEDYAQNAQSSSTPLNFIAGGFMEDLKLVYEEMNAGIENIRAVTGINEVADGSVGGGMLVGVGDQLMASTNNALSPYVNGYKTVYFNMIDHVQRKWRLSVLNGDVDIKDLPFSDKVIKNMKITKGISAREFGVYLRLAPSEDKKRLMIQDLVGMKEKGMIPIDAYFVAMRMIEDNDLKKSEMYIVKAVKDEQAANHQRQMEVAQANAQGNAEAAKVTEMMKSEQANRLLEKEMSLERVKGEVERETATHKTDQDIRKIRVQEGLKAKNAQALEGVRIAQKETSDQRADERDRELQKTARQ